MHHSRFTAATRLTTSARTVIALALITLSVGLTACGGGSNAPDSVDEQLGFTDEGRERRQARAENLIATCMKAQGFDYVPVDTATHRAALFGNATLNEEEFEKQYGYGITTLFVQSQNVAVGPNEATRGRLSPSAQNAYDLALVGDKGGTYFQAWETGDFSQLGGCTKSAVDEVFGGAAVLVSLQAKLTELDQRIKSDPRVVEAIRLWAGCMRTAGYDLAHPQEVDATLYRKLEAVVGKDAAAGKVRGAAVKYDASALAALQGEELIMVAADIRCERQHINPIEDKVREELESTFREENAALFQQVSAP